MRKPHLDAHRESSLKSGLVELVAVKEPRLKSYRRFLLGLHKKNRLRSNYLVPATPKEKITNVIATVTPEIILRTWTEVDYCLDVCRATGGAEIETYSIDKQKFMIYLSFGVKTIQLSL